MYFQVSVSLLAACSSVSLLAGQAQASRSLAPDHASRKVENHFRESFPKHDCSSTGQQLTRRLQDTGSEASVALVSTPLEFQQALESGAEHVVIDQHLDFTQFQATTHLNWTAAFHVPEGVKSIQGNCISSFPTEAALGLAETDEDLLPQKPGQCLLTFNDSLLALQSTSGGKVLLENLYLRDVRDDADTRILVALASGRKYDSSSVDTGKGMFLSHVTVQGTGYNPLRGLYTTGWVYAEDSVFAHLGFAEGLPPVKVRFEGTTATFFNCFFQDNFTPNDFGPILAEDNAAVRLEQSLFKNNTPELLDAFSGGRFFSDVVRSVWNNPTATYIKSDSIAQADASNLIFLNATDPFLLTEEVQSSILPTAAAEFAVTDSEQEELSAEVEGANAPVATAPKPSDAQEDEDDTPQTAQDDLSPTAADGNERRRRRDKQVTSPGGRKLV